MDSIRINKYLAEQGYASRREADRLVEAGHVKINGQVAELGDHVSPKDKVEVNLPATKKIYLAYHKPRGEATEEIVPPREGSGTKLFPIGRLDKDSEGLLIFTNDGRLTDKLIGDKTHVEKEYLVRVDKKLDGLDLKRMSEGVKIENYLTKPAEASRLDDHTLRIIVTEGKKHQLRRMCAALGYQVKRLKRIRIDRIRLGKQLPGTFREIEFNLSRSAE